MAAGEVLCRVGLDGKFRYTNLNEFVIGSSTESDLVIPGQGVADRHLKVTVHNGHMTVENLSANSTTRVGGQEVTGRVQVSYKSGDKIQLGGMDATVTLELFAPFGTAPAPDPELQKKIAEIAELETQACIESEQLIATARVQAEEKIREAIEEGHAQAEVMAEEAERRAKATAQSLITSAKAEVDVLINQAQATSAAILRDGEAKKRTLSNDVEETKKVLTGLQGDVDQFKAEAAHCESICNDARRKKAEYIEETKKAEALQAAAQKKLESLQQHCRESEGEWQGIQQQIHRGKEANSQIVAEAQKVQERISELKREEGTLRARFETLGNETNEAETKKNEVFVELQRLEDTRVNELQKLKQQIDDEYQRQLAVEKARIVEIREQELMAQQQLQARFEKLDSKWSALLIKGLNERLFQLVTDRATLYGLDKVKENAEFKKDLEELTARSLNEEFELRRTKILETVTPAESLMRRRRMRDGAKVWIGWATAAALLGFVLLGHFKQEPNPRAPAATANH